MDCKWCTSCQRNVAVAMQAVAKSAALPLTGAVLGGIFGQTQRRRGDNLARPIVAGGIGLLLGAIATELTPAAQRIVCGECGCSHLSEPRYA